MGGLATYGKQTALAAILPNGTNAYVGLPFTLPSDDDGTGLVEASGAGYARKAHSAWTSIQDGTVWYRRNTGSVTLAALTAHLENVYGWGIWTAITGGSLIAWGPLLDAGGDETVKSFFPTNQPSFLANELKVGID